MKEKLCYQMHVTEAASCCYVCWEANLKDALLKTRRIKRPYICIFIIQTPRRTLFTQ